MVVLRHAARVNGLTTIALTKLDVLSGIARLKVAVAYERNGERIDYFPAEYGMEALAQWEPVYADLPGWEEDITGARRREDLPPTAREYVARIEEWTGVPVTFVGVGPAREQAIV